MVAYIIGRGYPIDTSLFRDLSSVASFVGEFHPMLVHFLWDYGWQRYWYYGWDCDPQPW